MCWFVVSELTLAEGRSHSYHSLACSAQGAARIVHTVNDRRAHENMNDQIWTFLSQGWEGQSKQNEAKEISMVVNCPL